MGTVQDQPQPQVSLDLLAMFRFYTISDGMETLPLKEGMPEGYAGCSESHINIAPLFQNGANNLDCGVFCTQHLQVTSRIQNKTSHLIVMAGLSQVQAP